MPYQSFSSQKGNDDPWPKKPPPKPGETLFWAGIKKIIEYINILKESEATGLKRPEGFHI